MDSTKDPVEPALLFERHQSLIARVVHFACRRGSFGPDEAADFASVVNLKLIDDDYAILRKFQGLCSLETYLVTVVHRLALDYRDQKWGKWRPSTAAKRRGPLAVQLETLVYRDGRSLSEAIDILRANRRVELSEFELEELFADLPRRTRRHQVEEEALEGLPAPQPGPSEILEEKERRGEWEKAVNRLRELMSDLPVEDRTILRMHYFEGLKLADVARALRLDAKPLYRRVESLRASFRRQLEEEGFRAEQVFDATE